MTLRQLAASALLALPVLAGCAADQSLNPPDLDNNEGLMARYVAMGNSITAGLQSAGINEELQRQSYARLFALRAGAPFFIPSLSMPGCPPPLVNNITLERLGGATPTTCALRKDEFLPYVSNLAVPETEVGDLLDPMTPDTRANALTTFILGGRTQVEAMLETEPTFVSLWVGNNDVLGALTNSADPGDEALITPVGEFTTDYTAVLDAIEESGAQGAALIGVADVSSIPFASTGAIYWCLSTGACPGVPQSLPPALTVLPSCAPAATGIVGAQGDQVLVPWPVGVPKIAAAAQGLPQTLDCTLDTEVVLPEEFAAMTAAVSAYNAFIEEQATQRGWAYVDVNPALLELKATPLPENPYEAPIVNFPILPTEGAPTESVFFGTFFSLDGVHPSGVAHRVIADSLISAVNQTYATSIPFVGP
jgi:lysophospholipase L1-like esterase